MEFNLKEIGIDKVVDIVVTGRIVRLAAKSNRELINNEQELNNIGKEMAALDDNDKLSEDEKAAKNLNDYLGVLDKQVAGTEIIEKALKGIFNLSKKETEAILDVDYDQVQSAYQDIILKIITNDASAKDSDGTTPKK